MTMINESTSSPAIFRHPCRARPARMLVSRPWAGDHPGHAQTVGRLGQEFSCFPIFAIFRSRGGMTAPAVLNPAPGCPPRASYPSQNPADATFAPPTSSGPSQRQTRL